MSELNGNNDFERNDGQDLQNDTEKSDVNVSDADANKNGYKAEDGEYSVKGAGQREWKESFSAENANGFLNGVKPKRQPMSVLAAVMLSISVLVLCTTVLLVSFVVLGRDDGFTDVTTGDEWENLYIDDGEETTLAESEGADESVDTLETGGAANDEDVSTEAELEWVEDVTFPENAEISKAQPLRKDGDGDGKADVVTDDAGNVLTSADKNMLSVATVVNNVADSVVEIRTETVTNSSWVGQYVMTGAGSGVIISPEGYIVTNNHVIEGADNIIVRMTDGSEHAAYLVGSDADTDIAVIWIDPSGRTLSTAQLGCSFDLVVGEDILAIGNPLGSLGGTVTDGIISATERNITIDGTPMTLLQISAPINPGNSGGGLFNRAGQLVGIVNAKCSSEEVEGLGFAIPIDKAYDIITELIDYRYVRGKAGIGLTLVDVTSSQTAMVYFNSRYIGVYVYESKDTDELKYGDLIVSVDDVKIESTDDIENILRQKGVGDVITVNVYRSSTGKMFDVELTLTEYIPEYLIAA